MVKRLGCSIALIPFAILLVTVNCPNNSTLLRRTQARNALIERSLTSIREQSDDLGARSQ